MATYVVTDPGSGNDIYPNFQAAVNLCAATGDTILVPPVMRPYTGQVTTTKRFKLCTLTPAYCLWTGFNLGNYDVEDPINLVNQAIWYRPESIPDSTLETGGGGGTSMAFIKFNDPSGSPQTSVTTDGIVISDIEFRSKIPSLNGTLTDGGSATAPDGLSQARDYALVFNKSVDFQVTRCTFKYFGNAAIRYDHWDSVARGVIYKCNFEQNAKGSNGGGFGYGVVCYGQNLSWITNPKFGSNNFLFIENCRFNLHRHSTAGGGCGRYVARYNYIQDNLVTYGNSCHAIDAHGRRGGSLGGENYFSTHTVEAYNNKLIQQYKYDPTHTSQRVPLGDTPATGDLLERGIHLKECFHLSYNNTIKGYRFGSAVQIEQINVYSDGNTGYPQKYTFGEPSAITGGSSTPNGDLGDSWIWNNSFVIYNSQCFNFFNYTPSIFVANRDYHLSPYTYTNADSTGSGSAFTYPHPLRDDLTPVNNIFLTRKFRSRVYHSR